jgi:hypothetical protein
MTDAGAPALQRKKARAGLALADSVHSVGAPAWQRKVVGARSGVGGRESGQRSMREVAEPREGGAAARVCVSHGSAVVPP